MANLTVSVTRNGSNLVVSGSANAAVTITVGGQTITVQPDANGYYTGTLAGTTGTVNVTSSQKAVAVELDAPVEAIDIASDLLALEAVRAKQKPGNAIEVSGKFKDDSSPPASVACTRVANGEVQTGTVANKKWSVEFRNCPGNGHKFKLRR